MEERSALQFCSESAGNAAEIAAEENLCRTAAEVYKDLTLSEAESYIESNLVTAARAYVANGYFLKRIRDDRLYEDDGYQSFEEYVRERYGKDKGWASKCIKVNSQLSIGGDSPNLDNRYKDYSTYQLVELAYMDEDQREQASPDKTVKQLQEMRRPKEIPYYEIDGQMDISKDFPDVLPTEPEVVMLQLSDLTGGEGEQPDPAPQEMMMDVSELMGGELQEEENGDTEAVSYFGAPKTVRPEGSLITTSGCGNGKYDCFSCSRECNIRQDARQCIFSTCGNPEPCGIIDNEKWKKGIQFSFYKDECQMLHQELAPTRAGDGEPSPCCQNCDHRNCLNRCDVAKKNDAERKRFEDQKSEPPEEHIPLCIFERVPCEMETKQRQYGKEVMGCNTECCVYCDNRGSCQYECQKSVESRPAEVVTSQPEQTQEKVIVIDMDSCPPYDNNCIRLEWGTTPEEQARGHKECVKCWSDWKRKQEAAFGNVKWVPEKRGTGTQEKIMEPEPAASEPEDIIDTEFEEVDEPKEEPAVVGNDDFYDSRILTDMIDEAENELEVMGAYWKANQPHTYKKHLMKLAAYKMYRDAYKEKEEDDEDVC